MNQDYYDDEQDWEDDYHPLYDFRKSKWLYEREQENKRSVINSD